MGLRRRWGQSLSVPVLRLSVWLLLGHEPGCSLRISILPEKHDNFFIILMYGEGLAPGATLAIDIANRLPANGTVIVLLSSQQWNFWVQHPLRALPGGGFSSYLISSWREPLHHRVVSTTRIEGLQDDRYFVGVLNVHQEPVLLEGTLEFENPGGQHLPMQMVYLPEVLWASSVAFLILFLVVALLLSLVWRRGVTLLHGMVALCIWLKAAELAFRWNYFDHLAHHGAVAVWRFQVWQLVQRLHAMVELLVLLLIALGWRVLRPSLRQSELRCMMLGLSLAGALVLFQASRTGADFEEPSEGSTAMTDNRGVDSLAAAEPMLSFTLFFYIAKVACYLIIIFAMNFHLQLIAVHLQESPVSEATAVLYQKQQIYLWFRRLFLAIVFRPSALLWLRVSVFGVDGGEWVVSIFAEGSYLALWTALFATLQPNGPARLLMELMRVITRSPVLPAEPVLEEASWEEPPRFSLAEEAPPPAAELPVAAAAVEETFAALPAAQAAATTVEASCPAREEEEEGKGGSATVPTSNSNGGPSPACGALAESSGTSISSCVATGPAAGSAARSGAGLSRSAGSSSSISSGAPSGPFAWFTAPREPAAALTRMRASGRADSRPRRQQRARTGGGEVAVAQWTVAPLAAGPPSRGASNEGPNHSEEVSSTPYVALAADG